MIVLSEFENIIAEQFSFVKALRNDDNKSAVVLRHKNLDTEIVVREFGGDTAVYEKLKKMLKDEIIIEFYLKYNLVFWYNQEKEKENLKWLMIKFLI